MIEAIFPMAAPWPCELLYDGVMVVLTRECKRAVLNLLYVKTDDLPPHWTITDPVPAGWYLPINGIRAGDVIAGWEVSRIVGFFRD